MSPVRAFLLLLALLVLAGVVLLMTTRPERAEPIQMERSQGAGDNGVTQEGPGSRPEERLTKAEAKKKFRDLRSEAYKAIETRDLNLVRHVYTTDGPLLPRVLRQVRALIRDDVVAKSRARLLHLKVLVHTPEGIEIRSKTRFFPCFTDATGRDVTVDRSIFEEIAKWTLQKQRRAWRIHDHVQNSYQPLDGKYASCP
ncbi:hypothetical protein BH20ACT22_BH20ACT22_00270 [soil metagenome]